MNKIVVIKGRKRNDIWDFSNNKPIADNLPIGYTIEVEGQIPESFIKYEPNRIFDRRKYPDLYSLFGKDHLPNENELKCFIEKNRDAWFGKPSLWSRIKLKIKNIFKRK